MNREWEHIGTIPRGGAVLQIIQDEMKRLWAASPAGLFSSQGDQWKAVVGGFPYTQVHALLEVKGQLFVTGFPEGIMRSLDSGVSWQQCNVEQTRSPVICLAASPRHDRDGILLAGTAQDGLLRSTDRGRFWNLANFGLRDFTILSLATAGDWSRSRRPVPEEVVFAGTQAGVYCSPNGGRAWKYAGLEDLAVLALAASPHFDQDRVVFAGTEDQGLFRSSDGGKSWQIAALGLPGSVTVNAMNWDRQGRLWAAIAGRGLWISIDSGASWTHHSESPEDILCLSDTDRGLAAGLVDQGLAWFSGEKGQWQFDEGLAARRFQWLLTLPAQAAEPGWYAGGQMEDPWVSWDGGETWQPTSGPPAEGSILDMAVSRKYLWAGSQEGLWRISAGELEGKEGNWQLVVDGQGAILTLSTCQDVICAGTEAGSLWISEDDSDSWRQVNLPAAQALPLDVVISPTYDTDHTLWVAAGKAGQRDLWVWRCRLPPVGEPDWELVLDERSDWQNLHLTCMGGEKDQLWIGLGSTILRRVGSSWQSVELPAQGAPVRPLVIGAPDNPSRSLFLAVAGGQVFASPDGLLWQTQPGLNDLAVADLQVVTDAAGQRTLYALTLEGLILQGRVE